MTQWLFNFVIAKLTPIMLDRITYGTFLLFGACCILMLLYAVFFVPETKGVPLESINLLFKDNIVAGATKDTIPRFSRAKNMQAHHLASGRTGEQGGKDLDDEERESQAVHVA
jgi:MFS transporter, SP family, sugar:H+ symporter